MHYNKLIVNRSWRVRPRIKRKLPKCKYIISLSRKHIRYATSADNGKRVVAYLKYVFVIYSQHLLRNTTTNDQSPSQFWVVVLWVITLFSPVVGYQHFGENFCIHFVPLNRGYNKPSKLCYRLTIPHTIQCNKRTNYKNRIEWNLHIKEQQWADFFRCRQVSFPTGTLSLDPRDSTSSEL
jgi:hypothetical protein